MYVIPFLHACKVNIVLLGFIESFLQEIWQQLYIAHVPIDRVGSIRSPISIPFISLFLHFLYDRSHL